jgi:hypothetical protein
MLSGKCFGKKKVKPMFRIGTTHFAATTCANFIYVSIHHAFVR